jgi:hypothetical protein
LPSSLNKWAVLSCCAESVTKYCVGLRRCCEARCRHERCRHELRTTPSILRQRTALPSPIPNSGGSGGVDERGLQAGVGSTLRDPKGSTDRSGGQPGAMHAAIHAHLRHAHEQRDLGNGGKPCVGRSSILGQRAPHVLFFIQPRTDVPSARPLLTCKNQNWSGR